MDGRRETSDIRAGRQRLRELRETRRMSVAESVSRSRTTVIANLIIEVLSGVFFAVGVYYALRFLDMQRPNMEPIHYRIFSGAFVIIALGWFTWLFWKIRANVLRLRELGRIRRGE